MTGTKNKFEIRPNANQINNIYVQTRDIGFVRKVPSTSATDRESMNPVRETWMFHPLCSFRMFCRSAFTLCRPNNETLKKNVRTVENVVQYVVLDNLEPQYCICCQVGCAPVSSLIAQLWSKFSFRGGPAVQPHCRTTSS